MGILERRVNFSETQADANNKSFALVASKIFPEPKPSRRLHRSFPLSRPELNVSENYTFDSSQEGRTPLHMACGNGFVDSARCLILNGGAKINQLDAVSTVPPRRLQLERELRVRGRKN